MTECPAGKTECVHYNKTNRPEDIPLCTAYPMADTNVRYFEACPFRSKIQAPKKDPWDLFFDSILQESNYGFTAEEKERIKKAIMKAPPPLPTPKPTADIEALAEKILDFMAECATTETSLEWTIKALKKFINPAPTPVDVEKVFSVFAKLSAREGGRWSINKAYLIEALEAGRVPIQKPGNVDKAWEAFQNRSMAIRSLSDIDHFRKSLRAGSFPV